MILDVFPSYKDKDMVDLLYQYQRDSRLSISLLVEKYLEELLYKQGYLTVEIEEEKPIMEHEETDQKSQNKEKYISYMEDRQRYYVNKWIDKRKYSFGNYETLKEAKQVKDFLISKNWDKKYSTKTTGLKGKKYVEWIFSEIENEVDVYD